MTESVRQWSRHLWARLVVAHGDGPEARRLYVKHAADRERGIIVAKAE